MKKLVLVLSGLWLLSISAFPFSFHQEDKIPENGSIYPDSRFMKIDSVILHYRVVKPDMSVYKGKVLFIHGFCGSTFNWRNNIDTLVASGYKVVIVDLPGFGYSSRNLINQSHSNRARILWDMLRQIDEHDTLRWNIVGHSMGGGVAEAMALMEPSRTKSLTIVDGMVFIHNHNIKGAFITATKMKGINKTLVSYMKKNMITYKNIRRAYRQVYGYPPDSNIVENYLKPLQIPGTAESIINMFAYSKEIVTLDAQNLKGSDVLIIWGKKDRTIYLRTGKLLNKTVPGSTLKIIPECRHSPMETHPEKFNLILLNFLEKNNR
ncbi:MAG: alpha/beta hydrolase [Bacteroidota bacterium]|nr:alpha/beta hydrolase [Bacteroidota bacterium]